MLRCNNIYICPQNKATHIYNMKNTSLLINNMYKKTRLNAIIISCLLHHFDKTCVIDHFTFKSIELRSLGRDTP